MSRKNLPDSREEMKLSFEEAFARLGEVVERLESGKLTLEQATRLYEEGMRLAQACNQLLGQAEMRVTELKNALSTHLAEEEWDSQDSEHS